MVMETRQLLSTGHIAKPTQVGGINGMAASAADIVDDVHAFVLNGVGTWRAAYQATGAAAAAVTEGQAVGGTGATFNYVDINPAEWGILDEISKQVKKQSPWITRALSKTPQFPHCVISRLQRSLLLFRLPASSRLSSPEHWIRISCAILSWASAPSRARALASFISPRPIWPLSALYVAPMRRRLCMRSPSTTRPTLPERSKRAAWQRPSGSLTA